MKTLESFLLGYLFNALWQIPLILLAAVLAARSVRALGPRAEYAVWSTALLLEAVLPACTLSLGSVRALLGSLLGAAVRGGQGQVRFAVAEGHPVGFGTLALPPVWAHGLALFYIAATLYAAIRMVVGLRRTARLRRGATPFEMLGSHQILWQRCLGRLSGRGAGIAVVTASDLSGPVTIGIRQRLLLLPAGFSERVSSSELDAVLAHEFAHIQRRDFAQNLFLHLVTLPAAFHPLLPFTARRLAESREIVCDSFAADLLHGRASYARALLGVASLLSSTPPSRTLHAIGILDAHSFERRLTMLTQPLSHAFGVRRILLTLAGVTIAGTACASALALHLQVAAAAPIHVAGNVQAGMIASKVMPIYPAEARADKNTLDGAVLLRVIIGKDGVPQNIQIAKSLRSDYDSSALTAVSQWRWHPYLLNGVPTEVDTEVTITYSMGN